MDSWGILDYAQPWLGGLGVILMFHRVVEPGTSVFDTSLAVDSDSLDRMLAYIRHRDWDILSCNELYDRLSSGSPARPFVCCTFDDGYADTLRIALPVFRRYQAPLCVNVTVGYVDRTTPAWWDALGELLLERNWIEYDSPMGVERIPVTTWEEKTTAYYRLRTILHQEVNEGRPPLGSTWSLNDVDPRALSSRFFMNWEELQELASDALVQIGGHTLTHPSLAHLDERTAAREIEQSKRILEHRLGVKVEHFAYPFGHCGPREFRFVRQMGFKTAFTTRWCNIFCKHREYMTSLPRKFFGYNDVSEPIMRARLYGEDLALKPWKRVVLE